MKYSTLLMFCVIAVTAACATSPQAQYYTLSSMPGRAHAGKPLTLKVRRPVIPTMLDRPEMISQSNDFRVTQNDNHLWSEPLDKMMERVLAEDMRLRLPGSMVVTESSGVPVKDAYVLDVEIQQFGTDAAGNALLQAQAVVHSPNGRERPLQLALHGGHVSSAESMAKDLSDLLGTFSDSAAGSL